MTSRPRAILHQKDSRNLEPISRPVYVHILNLGVVLARGQGALVGLGGPVHALPVGEGGEVGVAVDAHVEVLAPHAEAARAVAARRTVAAGGGARRRARPCKKCIVDLISSSNTRVKKLALW